MTAFLLELSLKTSRFRKVRESESMASNFCLAHDDQSTLVSRGVAYYLSDQSSLIMISLRSAKSICQTSLPLQLTSLAFEPELVQF